MKLFIGLSIGFALWSLVNIEYYLKEILEELKRIKK